MIRTVLIGLGILILLAGAYVAGGVLNCYGELQTAGTPTPARLPESLVTARAREQSRAAARISSAPSRQILFGDLHVHTTYSADAFLWSLPMMNGEGAHPVSDACDYARFCSQLDFWSINDHAEATTPRKWNETIDAIRQCSDASGDPDNPDVAVFLGWEWTQVGTTPEQHWGHKNVILLGLEDDEITPRPIGAGGFASQGLRGQLEGTNQAYALPFLDFPNRQPYFDFISYMTEIRNEPWCPDDVPSPDLPADCYEKADTPADLFRKLREWDVESIVIPHGNTWGFYSPAGTSWDKQLTSAHDDPDLQFLIEVMSGHGNSEEFRDWKAVGVGEGQSRVCPEPREDYLPSCWRAGQIIEKRCLDQGESDDTCAQWAAEARQLYVDNGQLGHHVVQGATMEEWLDAGQCRDCFRPSFNFRPRGSTQYALALGGFEDPTDPRRFRFGIIASSDNHRARPGTGYKQIDRKRTTEANGARSETWADLLIPEEEPLARPQPVEGLGGRGFAMWETERQASFFMTGGLAAVHTEGRSKEQIWDALLRKEVYGTSGPRILLWFNLLNAERPDGRFGPIPMGGEARLGENPRFEVRAVGAFQQKPGCPADSSALLPAEKLDRLCRGECYFPSDTRHTITRIEVVRIRPQEHAGEPVAPLIEDPWRVLACDGSPDGCVVHFEDPDFERDGRESVYYVRAIQEATPVINSQNLRCDRDAEGNCLTVHPCYGEDFKTDPDDTCAELSEERAWSSPIFIDPLHGRALVAAESE